MEQKQELDMLPDLVMVLQNKFSIKWITETLQTSISKQKEQLIH